MVAAIGDAEDLQQPYFQEVTLTDTDASDVTRLKAELPIDDASARDGTAAARQHLQKKLNTCRRGLHHGGGSSRSSRILPMRWPQQEE
jgi:hypothetical protein